MTWVEIEFSVFVFKRPKFYRPPDSLFYANILASIDMFYESSIEDHSATFQRS
jgi:hypothetical protein